MPSATELQNHSYSLVFDDDRREASQVIEFQGADTHTALDYVQRRLPEREIELFEDGRCLGTVKCTRDGFWLILPRHMLMHGSSATLP